MVINHLLNGMILQAPPHCMSLLKLLKMLFRFCHANGHDLPASLNLDSLVVNGQGHESPSEKGQRQRVSTVLSICGLVLEWLLEGS